jgi:prevent-host-death family protein
LSDFEGLSMRTIPASEMKQRFGACIEAAQAEPILVERSGRPSVVVVSVAEYRRLQRIEEAHWGALAQQASEEGLLSDEESAAWSNAMRERLSANA